MVATIFAWLIPLLMMPVGALIWFIAALAEGIDYSRDPRVRLAIWGGGSIFAAGLTLTAINIWELF